MITVSRSAARRRSSLLAVAAVVVAACGGGGQAHDSAGAAAPAVTDTAAAQNAAAAGIPAAGAGAVERADSATDSVVMKSVPPTAADSSLATGSRDSAAGVNRSGMAVSGERARPGSTAPAGGGARPRP